MIVTVVVDSVVAILEDDEVDAETDPLLDDVEARHNQLGTIPVSRESVEDLH